MRQHVIAAVAVCALSYSAYGADFKASEAPAAYSWTGFYAGANLDYQAGQTRWSEGPFGTASVFDLGKGYDFSSGTGS